MCKYYKYNSGNVNEYDAAQEFDRICGLYAQMKTLKEMKRNAKDEYERNYYKGKIWLIKYFIFRELDEYIEECDIYD